MATKTTGKDKIKGKTSGQKKSDKLTPKKKSAKAKPKTKLKAKPKKSVKKLVKKTVKKSTTKSKAKKVVKKSLKKKKPTIAKTKEKPESIKLERSMKNPIIKPRPYAWESWATFNPTAVEVNGRVHLIYRAIGGGDVSVLGYASSLDGYNIDERLTHFIYRRFNPSFMVGNPLGYSSGGGLGGGTEDPRATVVGDRLYVFYNAFDNWSSCRVAMVSIDLDDFKNKRWNKWSHQIFLSPPNEINKAWVLFPEKINGKFAIIHDIWPSVSVKYFDSFDEFEKGQVEIKQNWDRWFHDRIPGHWVYIHPGSDGGRFVNPEALKKNIWTDIEKDVWIRNPGPSPMKTKEGWLVLFHAMEARHPGRFKLFAMLLDLKDPTRVLHKSAGPVLEPNEHYEGNIIYSCGAVIKSGRLFVYYGGGDSVIGVASIKLQELLDDLRRHKEIKLKKGKTEEIKTKTKKK